MIARFRVWMVAGKRPEWSNVRVTKAEPGAADSWTVVVEGDGTDLERYIRTRQDLFTLYKRVTLRGAER